LFSYYGSKSKIVDYYPYPKFDKIIEPFAGSARYALKHFEKDVLLVDKYEVIVKVWKYLQQASEKDIMSLPEPKLGQKINRDDFDCIEQAWLMGFLVQQGVSSPMLTVSPFSDGNIKRQKRNIATQLYKIKHWEIRQDDYFNILNTEATWFIDPPYQIKGYKYIQSKIDYEYLAKWSKSRLGQVIVCENIDATWLPFKKIIDFTGATQKNTEAIWSNYPTVYDNEQQNLF